ncbi:MAG: WGR domain-containing protein [Sulfurovum sp.]|nr:WGR domain-containing protein [Sulfurovum sp.]
MKTILIRAVNNRFRYYKLELIGNLFGESVLIRTYGSLLRTKPTRTITELYSNHSEAYEAYQTLLMQKSKRGYCPKGQ